MSRTPSPATQIKNLTSEVKGLRESNLKLASLNSKLQKSFDSMKEDRNAWRDRFDLLLSKIEAPKIPKQGEPS